MASRSSNNNQIETRNDNLAVRNGQLQMESCDLADLTRHYGTLLFVLSAEQLRHNYRCIERAFAQRWPEGSVHILPAFKAGPYLAVRQLLSALGAGCDTFGESEVFNTSAVAWMNDLRQAEPFTEKITGNVVDRYLLRED